MNIETSSAIMIVSVRRALSASGGSNTGTEFEITSIPVIAVAPEENARRISNTPSASVAWCGGGATAWKPCVAESTSPTITISAIAAMNM